MPDANTYNNLCNFVHYQNKKQTSQPHLCKRKHIRLFGRLPRYNVNLFLFIVAAVGYETMTPPQVRLLSLYACDDNNQQFLGSST